MRKFWCKSANLGNLIRKYSKETPNHQYKSETQIDGQENICNEKKNTKVDIQKIQPLLNNLYTEQKFEDLKSYFKKFLQENQSSQNTEFYTHLHYGITNFFQSHFEYSIYNFQKSLELIDGLKDGEREPYELFFKGMLEIQRDKYQGLEYLAQSMIYFQNNHSLLDFTLLLKISHSEFYKNLLNILELEGNKDDQEVDYKRLIDITNILVPITHEYSAMVYYNYANQLTSDDPNTEEILKKAYDLSEKMEIETQYNSHVERKENLYMSISRFKMILERNKDPEFQINCCLSLAKCYIDDISLVQKYVDQAFKIAEENGYDDTKIYEFAHDCDGLNMNKNLIG